MPVRVFVLSRPLNVLNQSSALVRDDFSNGPDFVPTSFHDFDVGIIGGRIWAIGHSALGPKSNRVWLISGL
jgi:hypothetical protein